MEETAAALPDDAVREILARVEDATAVFRCATTCRRWRALVADPFFFGCCWPKDSPGSSSLLGFFAPWRRDRELVFVPAPQAALSIGRSFLGLFSPDISGLLHGAKLLASRRGLLLMSLHHGVPLGAIHLAVCNPLTGTCDVLPPLECNAFFSTTCYAILTAADCCWKGQQISPSQGYSTFFKVLIIGSSLENMSLLDDYNFDEEKCDLHMFSSDGSSWTVFREWYNIRGDISPEVRSAVVCGGTAYWLLSSRSSYYTLQVSADSGGHVSVAKICIPSRILGTLAPRLGVAVDGTLSLLCLRRDRDQVEEWTRRDGDGGAVWVSTRVIELRRSKQKRSGRRRPRVVRSGRAQAICVGERSNMLLFMDPRIHIAHLQTGRTEYITGQFNGLDEMACVPFEVDWATFFSSRLGGSNHLG